MHIRSLLSFVALMAAPLAAQERPNILLIVVDDQSPFDLGIYEPSSTCRTPVIDALAARGTVVDGAYHMGSWSGAV
ncbi:MAG: sulfatase, partial [Planctomycetota bacterium]|nr:sulfatase [Planctomycetota bacterium]